ncbi:hypothetical protein [Streptomyces sp. NPDC057429]|uniref:hypothetical protein n=1 Tax=Streptomyces sp. NPDC057429 TaxID=3346130 RepID=UPI00368F5F45
MSSHRCVPTGAGPEIHGLWESEEAMEKFGTLIMPIAQRQGLPPSSGPPGVSPVRRYRVSGA